VAVDSSEGHLGLELVERYQLTEELARGALCMVYRGNDVILRRPVAVKAVPPELRETYRASLVATTTLVHPATIALYDAIEHDEWLFLVQEYVNAQALTAYLRQGVPSARAVDIGLQLARTLDHVHRREMLHGDLTPTAVFVDRHAVVRVNNFGLPPDVEYFERMHEQLVVPENDVDATIIRVAGGPDEPAERPHENEADPRARDVQAVGYLLWRLLSEPQGIDVNGRRALRPDVSAPVADVVRRCCAVPGEEAITSAGVLIGALEELAATLASERPAISTVTPPALRAARTANEKAAAWAMEETLAHDQVWAVSSPGKSEASVPTADTITGDLAVTRPSLDAAGVVRPGLRLPARAYPDELVPPPIPKHLMRPNAVWPGSLSQTEAQTARGGIGLGAVLLLGGVLFVIFFFIGYLLPITFGSGR
jgi:Protein kinase domain